MGVGPARIPSRTPTKSVPNVAAAPTSASSATTLCVGASDGGRNGSGDGTRKGALRPSQ